MKSDDKLNNSNYFLCSIPIFNIFMFNWLWIVIVIETLNSSLMLLRFLQIGVFYLKAELEKKLQIQLVYRCVHVYMLKN